MRILLVGEYSRLHNSLKEGLILLGHDVQLVSSGDGFKGFSSDFSYQSKWSTSKIVNIPRQIIYRIFEYDFAELERGFRFRKLLKKLKDYDVVQLINERPIQTNSSFEIRLLKKLFLQNKKTFVLSCGVDYRNVRFMQDHPEYKSILNPLQKDPELEKSYSEVLLYISKSNEKLHHFVHQNCDGIIASDMDYVAPLAGIPKFLGMIPNPINSEKLVFSELQIETKIVLFLGINRWNYIQKGILYFEHALKIIKEKYADRIEIIVTENIPYATYIELYNTAHIVLDQIFAHDQGYNALEAMAKGKVVFSGAEPDFEAFYQSDECVVINAKPDVDYLVSKLSFLIENPEEITKISRNARAFIEREHDYISVAKKYLETWLQP